MGNSVPASKKGSDRVRGEEDGNLYMEARDMGALSFLVYTWGYVLDALGESNVPSQENWTPREVDQLIKANKAALQEKYRSHFEDGSTTYSSMDLLIERSEATSKGARALTMELYDYEFQTHELVYGICKDSQNKRITLVFRGTENALAFKANWAANLSIGKTPEAVPAMLEREVGEKTVWIHSGFFNYMNAKTLDPSDNSETTKRKQIIDSVKSVLRKYPDYKIYVTGHSLGGALATVAAYYLSIDDDLPKPVTCVNFASPRVGDGGFLRAMQALEKTGRLRHCRFVNENDTITVIPTINYKHVGFMVKLHENKEREVEVSYPKVGEGWGNWLARAWDMSWPASFNVTYDHGEYRERIETHKDKLEEYDLSEMYADDSNTGF